jgi:predicted RNA binding protein YcfA (HicA-like mRNA interferase family)
MDMACHRGGEEVPRDPICAEAGRLGVLRQRGSYGGWGKPGEEARIVVAGKGSGTVPVGTLPSIRRASGLSLPEPAATTSTIEAA